MKYIDFYVDLQTIFLHFKTLGCFGEHNADVLAEFADGGIWRSSKAEWLF